MKQDRKELEAFAEALTSSPLAVFAEGTYTPIPAATIPVVMPDQVWEEITRDARLVLTALQKVTSGLRFGEMAPTFRHLFEPISQYEQAVSTPMDLATARLDMFFDGDDLKIIEINATIPAMQAYSDMIKLAYQKAYLPGRDLRWGSNTHQLLSSLLHHYRKAGGRSPQPCLAIVAREGDSQMAELKWLQSHWGNLGYETLILTPEQLSIKGDHLVFEGRMIDLVYRHIFAHRLDPQSAFAKACLEAGRYRIFNPIAADLELKSVLAELSRISADPTSAAAFDLSSEEREAVLRRLIWSRSLRTGPALGPDNQTLEDLIPWVKENRDQLVIKSSQGYGGQNVFLGSDFEGSKAQTRVQKLMGQSQEIPWVDFVQWISQSQKSDWIVQKRVAGQKMKQKIWSQGQLRESTVYVDCSIFANSGVDFQVNGGVCRFSENPIVNIGQGGGLVPFLLQSEIGRI